MSKNCILNENKRYSKNDVKRAGKTLIENANNSEALEILSIWRSEHAFPLENAINLLKSIATEIDKSVILAKRLKRTESIIKKLDRYKNTMYLSTMNDIGGCRIVVSNIKKVYRLVKFLTSDNTFKIRRDYIQNPKEDGYKSIHLIGNFKNEHGELRPIELQIRTKVQHSWATALEIVDLFTHQSIKTNLGKKEWVNFFINISRQFTHLEENIYLHTESTPNNIVKNYILNFKKNESEIERHSLFQVYNSCKKLEIIQKFHLFKESISNLSELTVKLSKQKNIKNAYVLIKIAKIGLETEIQTYKLEIKFFEDIKEANREYLLSEKSILLGGSYIAALVSTESLDEIKEAYPNYFADSEKFILYLRVICEAYEIFNPGIMFRTIDKIKYLFRKNK